MEPCPLVGVITNQFKSGHLTCLFWQRDSVAIWLYTRAIAIQKLNYIHANPLAGKWHLADDPCAYQFSSASFYAGMGTEYKWLKNLYEEF